MSTSSNSNNSTSASPPTASAETASAAQAAAAKKIPVTEAAAVTAKAKVMTKKQYETNRMRLYFGSLLGNFLRQKVISRQPQLFFVPFSLRQGSALLGNS